MARNDPPEQRPALILLFGAPAVGKITVGQQLERLTSFRLFHLHQVIDLVLQYFPYSTDPAPSYERLVVSYRTQLFEEAARSGLSIVTTSGWKFDLPSEEAAAQAYVRPFLENGGRVCFVELSAPLQVRVERNQTGNRRRHKRIDWATDDYLREDTARHRYDSGGVLPFDVPLLRLETESLSAEATAQRIIDHFGLPCVPEASAPSNEQPPTPCSPLAPVLPDTPEAQD